MRNRFGLLFSTLMTAALLQPAAATEVTNETFRWHRAMASPSPPGQPSPRLRPRPKATSARTDGMTTWWSGFWNTTARGAPWGRGRGVGGGGPEANWRAEGVGGVGDGGQRGRESRCGGAGGGAVAAEPAAAAAAAAVAARRARRHEAAAATTRAAPSARRPCAVPVAAICRCGQGRWTMQARPSGAPAFTVSTCGRASNSPSYSFKRWSVPFQWARAVFSKPWLVPASTA